MPIWCDKPSVKKLLGLPLSVCTKIIDIAIHVCTCYRFSRRPQPLQCFYSYNNAQHIWYCLTVKCNTVIISVFLNVVVFEQHHLALNRVITPLHCNCVTQCVTVSEIQRHFIYIAFIPLLYMMVSNFYN